MSGNIWLVLGFAFGSGIANMVFVIPSQTLFQERTPLGLMGRVVGFRYALVFGSMALAMALGGVLAEVVGVTVVLAGFGLVTMATGLAGPLRARRARRMTSRGAWVHWRPRQAADLMALAARQE